MEEKEWNIPGWSDTTIKVEIRRNVRSPFGEYHDFHRVNFYGKDAKGRDVENYEMFGAFNMAMFLTVASGKFVQQEFDELKANPALTDMFIEKLKTYSNVTIIEE